MKRINMLRLILWTLRIALLPFLLFWVVLAGQIASNYRHGGILGVESWFYWHVLVMGVPLEQQTTAYVLHLAHKLYLTVILLLVATEMLAFAQWQVSKKLNAVEKSKAAL